MALMAPLTPAQSTPGPIFSTQTPTTGMGNGVFYVFLPLVNTGAGTATNVRVTAATMGVAPLTSPALPLSLSALAPNGVNTLELHYNGSNLMVGRNYLLTVRGTYQSGTVILGFAVNRIITVQNASSFLETEIAQWAAIDALTLEANSLPGLDRNADNAALLAFIRGRPEFVDSDIDPDSSSVWATFANGRLIIIGNDFNLTNSATPAQPTVLTPLTSPAPSSLKGSLSERRSQISPLVASSASLAPLVPGTFSELPSSSSVRILTGVSGVGWDTNSNSLTDLTSWLKAQNYIPVAGADASVASLKTVGGDGVFFFVSHGDLGGRGNRQYGVWTSTKAKLGIELTAVTTGEFLESDVVGTATTPPTLITLLENEEQDLITGKWRKEWHYAITAQFVRTYFKPFSKASFVFLQVCDSDNAAAPIQDFKNAFFEKNASVYAGWTEQVNIVKAPNTARLIFDRLLGANQFALEMTPTAAGIVYSHQRPFDFVSAMQDMILHNDCPNSNEPADLLCGVDQHTGAVLKFTPNPNLTSNADIFGLLAPSIEFMVVFESAVENLTLAGLFGTDPGVGGAVTVGGTNPPAGMTSTQGGVELPTCIWHADLQTIGCGDLHPSGSGSSGNVQVTVRGHNSNIARITEWNGVFTYNMPAGGPGSSLNQRITLNPVFRGDLREFRPVIHDPPVLPSFPIEAVVPTTTAQFACTGSARTVTLFQGGSTVETDTWTGSGELPSFDLGSVAFGMKPPTNYFAVTGVLFFSNTFINMEFTARGPTVCNRHAHIVTTDNGKVVTTDDDFPFGLFNALDFVLNLDPATATIQPPANGALPDRALQCPPPLPCTAFLKWNAIPPVTDTAPDPNSAR
jgi:hypothetical protein